MSKNIEINPVEAIEIMAKLNQQKALIEKFLDTFFKMLEDKTEKETVRNYALSVVNICEAKTEECDIESDDHSFYVLYATWSGLLLNRLIERG